jgi:hypothetical protein
MGGGKKGKKEEKRKRGQRSLSSIGNSLCVTAAAQSKQALILQRTYIWKTSCDTDVGCCHQQMTALQTNKTLKSNKHTKRLLSLFFPFPDLNTSCDHISQPGKGRVVILMVFSFRTWRNMTISVEGSSFRLESRKEGRPAYAHAETHGKEKEQPTQRQTDRESARRRRRRRSGKNANGEEKGGK